MTKEVLIEKPSTGSRLLSYVLDLLSVALSTLVLYFIVIYSFFGVNYTTNQRYIKEKRVEYNLNMKYGEVETDEYEKVIKQLYFVDFKDEILDDFKKDREREDKKEWTIEYIYNVLILNLPEIPNSSNYKTDLFQYTQNSDGSYNIDALAIKNPDGKGEYFEKNLLDLFYTKYTELESLILKYDAKYNSAFKSNDVYENISRTISLAVSAMIFYSLIPYINKNGSTIFEKMKKIGYVNNRDYFEIKKYKVILRWLIYFALPCVGMYFGSLYTIVLLTILPLFINGIFILLSRNNKDLFEILLSAKSASLDESMILKNEDEFNDFAKKEEYENKQFVDKLADVNQLDVNQKE